MKKAQAGVGPKILDAKNLSLSWTAAEGLCLAAPGMKGRDIRVALCLPLSHPGALASVLTQEGKELALVRGLDGLDTASRKALDAAQRRQVLTARILEVKSLAHQFGAIYWSVSTDRGDREFVLKGVTEHVRWLSDHRLLITDVDGNRFEIPDLRALDKASRNHVDLVL